MKRRAKDRDITATVEVRDMNYAIRDIKPADTAEQRK
jgi:hypothetical protein